MIDTNKMYSLRRIFTLFLACLTGFGIRFFDEQANLFFILILLMNIRELKQIPNRYIKRFVVVMVCCFFFFYLKDMTVELWIIRAWIIALIIINMYRKRLESFCIDLSKLAEWSMYYSLLHIPAYLIFGTSSFGYGTTSLYLFFYNTADTFLGIPRVHGYAWEPSCWSYILIINLIFVLYNKCSKKKIVLSLLAILFCNSTTVIMSTVIIVALHLWFNIKKNRWLIPVAAVMIMGVFPFVQGKLNEKLNSGSGLARMSDFYIVKDVLSVSPILGADAYNVSNNMLAYKARVRALFDSGLLEAEVGAEGYYGEEMVNDFAALLVEWGIILGPFILLLYLKSPLIIGRELRILFLVGTIAVITGTPITRTPIFFLFPLSVLIMNPQSIKNLLKLKIT